MYVQAVLAPVAQESSPRLSQTKPAFSSIFSSLRFLHTDVLGRRRYVLSFLRSGP